MKPRLAQPTAWSLHQSRRPPPVSVCHCNQSHYTKHVDGTCDGNSANGTQANGKLSVIWTGHAVWNPVCLHGTYISSSSSVIRLLFLSFMLVSFASFFSFSFRYRFFWLSIPCVQFHLLLPPSLNFLLTATRLMNLISQYNDQGTDWTTGKAGFDSRWGRRFCSSSQYSGDSWQIRSFILVINQLDAQNFCFTISFSSCLYMFRAPYAHHQEVKIILYSIWYRHQFG